MSPAVLAEEPRNILTSQCPREHVLVPPFTRVERPGQRIAWHFGIEMRRSFVECSSLEMIADSKTVHEERKRSMSNAGSDRPFGNRLT